MIATHTNQQNQEKQLFDLPLETTTESSENDKLITQFKNLNSPSLLLPSHHIAHTPKAGLNPVVDAASYLFSVIGKLKNLHSYRRLKKLQTDLIREINHFQKAILHHGHNMEYVTVCRYVLCATLDDIILHSSWGAGQWEHYSLLSIYNQDGQHQDKFFAILERAILEPSLYIDLMELTYICLSMGYKGQYRVSEHNQYQLEQITNNLYKHIVSYRGTFSKILSPAPLKTSAADKTPVKNRGSLPFIFILTLSTIMAIFVSLSYLMDAISNESYKNITQIENTVSHKTFG